MGTLKRAGLNAGIVKKSMENKDYNKDHQLIIFSDCSENSRDI